MSVEGAKRKQKIIFLHQSEIVFPPHPPHSPALALFEMIKVERGIEAFPQRCESFD